jgi:melanoma-associated antigen
LACEFARKPIKRLEINAKVLGTNTRQFKLVFERAQNMLGDTFGMKLEELPVGEKVTLQQRRSIFSVSVYQC